MSEKDNGGPALLETCISIRDYFAAKAMQSLGNAVVEDGIDIEQSADRIAKHSYFMADAMLRARGEA